MTLDELPRDRRCVVTALESTGAERRRLMDLGVLPGAIMRASLTSPLGDPVAYEVRGSLIALRRRQAQSVHVKIDESA